MHPSHLEQYSKLTSQAKKRKAGSVIDTDNAETSKRPKLQQFITTALTNANLVSQSVVDKLVLNLVIDDLLPIKLVEQPAFVQLVSGLQPNRKVISRRTLAKKIEDSAADIRVKLIDMLKEQSHVATTADCWTSHGKFLLGMTVHWIDSQSCDRKSACLALRRVKGSHTFDVIAEHLEAIHSEFGIRRKIVRTTTDSGSNFVKAFTTFGEPQVDVNSEDESNDESGDDLGAENVTVVDLSTVLDENTPEYELPRHQRCAAHSLNLVATTDADKALENAAYKKIARSAFSKCQALWNKYGRSNKASETVTDTFGLGLKRPNETRWNSMFMAVERLVRIISENGEHKLNNVCTGLGVPRFSTGELAFLHEYTSAMKPVAQALNILQSEKNMFLAYCYLSLFCQVNFQL
jgi:hypothetical protein